MSDERWLITYADMITLLLAFFIIMYATAEDNLAKLQSIGQSIQSAFSLIPSDEGGGGEGLMPEYNSLIQALETIDTYLSDQIASGEVQVDLNERGLQVRTMNNALFDLGSADISESAIQILDTVAEAIIDMPNHIVVEGHTDDKPINTPRFPNNWYLSNARTASGITYFQVQKGIPGGRLSGRGFGEFMPIANNRTVEGASLNRRIDIIVTE
jgi:chemotaxis protein MotB